MKKSDLEYGNVIETRMGDKYLFTFNFNKGNQLLNLITGNSYLNLYEFHEDLTNCCNIFDAMKVYKDYTCKELLWERKEIPQLTEDEKVILKNIPKKYKYIARDRSGLIFLCSKKPSKCDYSWIGYNDIASPYDHLFQFIEWEDEEPYSIEDLLKGEEK